MILISFVCLERIRNFSKLGGCGSKIDPATPFWILNFKWAWQAQFLSHTLQILGKVIFLEDLHMMLLSSLEIFICTKVGKNVPKLDVQVWRSLCFNLKVTFSSTLSFAYTPTYLWVSADELCKNLGVFE